jgi:L-iditol 2-dehydrogenase
MSEDPPHNMAARLHAPGDIRVAEEAVDPPGPGEVRLRVTAVGLCGSDLHWFDEGSIGDAVLARPLVLGHEIAAVVEEGPEAGRRVAVDPALNCGRCDPCLEGRTNVCLAIRFAGHGTTDGGLRSFMVWPRRLLAPLPDGIADDVAPLLEPLGVAIHAVDLAALPPGSRAGVYGCGPLGLLIVAVLRAAGASTIVATDKLPHRVAAAAAMGATHALPVEGEGEPSPGREQARRLEVDVAFEVAGSDDALADAISAVRPGGRVVLVGIPPHDRTVFEAGAARRKELSLLECRRMMPADLGRAIDLVASGAVDLSSLVTHRYSIDEAGEAFAALASRRGIKTIVYPSSPRQA